MIYLAGETIKDQTKVSSTGKGRYSNCGPSPSRAPSTATHMGRGESTGPMTLP